MTYLHVLWVDGPALRRIAQDFPATSRSLRMWTLFNGLRDYLLDNLSKASEEERAAAKEWCKSRKAELETPVEKLRRGVRTIKMLNKLGGEGGPFGSEEEQKKRDEQKGKHGRKRRDADTLPELHSSITHRFDAVERSVVGLSTRLDRSVNDLKQRMDTSMGKVDAILGAMGLEVPPASPKPAGVPPPHVDGGASRLEASAAAVAAAGAAAAAANRPRTAAAAVGLACLHRAAAVVRRRRRPHRRRRRRPDAPAAAAPAPHGTSLPSRRCSRVCADSQIDAFNGVLARNSPWNFAIRSPTRPIWSSGGRKVVWKCHVPAFWPKPEPGTTTMPVFSRRCIA